MFVEKVKLYVLFFPKHTPELLNMLTFGIQCDSRYSKSMVVDAQTNNVSFCTLICWSVFACKGLTKRWIWTRQIQQSHWKEIPTTLGQDGEEYLMGFAIITWNNPLKSLKKLEKPCITKGKYLSIFRVPDLSHVTVGAYGGPRLTNLKSSKNWIGPSQRTPN